MKQKYVIVTGEQARGVVYEINVATAWDNCEFLSFEDNYGPLPEDLDPHTDPKWARTYEKFQLNTIEAFFDIIREELDDVLEDDGATKEEFIKELRKIVSYNRETGEIEVPNITLSIVEA